MVSSPVTQANLLDNFLEKFVPNLDLQFFKEKPKSEELGKEPSAEIDAESGQAKAEAEKAVPYTSVDVHEEAVIAAVEEA